MITYPEKYFMGGAQLPFPVRTSDEVMDHAIYSASGIAAELEIFSTGVGNLMTQEIDAAPHDIEVISRRSNSCIQVGDWRDGCYRELISDDAFVNTLHRLLNGDRFARASAAGVKLIEVIRRNSTTFAMIEGPAGPTGVKPVVISRIATNDEGRGKICYHIRDELTPGPGCKAMVSWNHAGTHADGGNGRILAAWNARPPWIALAHELIHAWRMVTGQVIFPKPSETYFEEAMTVGLVPYNGCKFTENAFRVAAGEAPRGFYGPSDLATTRGTGWIPAQPSPFTQGRQMI